MFQRRRLVPGVLVAAATAAAVLGGCSSSSSGGGSISPTTAPADSSETFHNVTPRANQIIQRNIALMRGVASNTYQGHDLVVTFRSTAKKVDQTNVENVVHQAQQKATSKKAGRHGRK